MLPGKNKIKNICVSGAVALFLVGGGRVPALPHFPHCRVKKVPYKPSQSLSTQKDSLTSHGPKDAVSIQRMRDSYNQPLSELRRIRLPEGRAKHIRPELLPGAIPLHSFGFQMPKPSGSISQPRPPKKERIWNAGTVCFPLLKSWERFRKKGTWTLKLGKTSCTTGPGETRHQSLPACARGSA